MSRVSMRFGEDAMPTEEQWAGWAARGLAAAAAFIAFGSLLFAFLMWSDNSDLRDRNTHIEQCADVAETIAGFRRCVDG